MPIESIDSSQLIAYITGALWIFIALCGLLIAAAVTSAFAASSLLKRAGRTLPEDRQLGVAKPARPSCYPQLIDAIFVDSRVPTKARL